MDATQPQNSLPYEEPFCTFESFPYAMDHPFDFGAYPNAARSPYDVRTCTNALCEPCRAWERMLASAEPQTLPHAPAPSGFEDVSQPPYAPSSEQPFLAPEIPPHGTNASHSELLSHGTDPFDAATSSEDVARIYFELHPYIVDISPEALALFCSRWCRAASRFVVETVPGAADPFDAGTFPNAEPNAESHAIGDPSNVGFSSDPEPLFNDGLPYEGDGESPAGSGSLSNGEPLSDCDCLACEFEMAQSTPPLVCQGCTLLTNGDVVCPDANRGREWLLQQSLQLPEQEFEGEDEGEEVLMGMEEEEECYECDGEHEEELEDEEDDL